MVDQSSGQHHALLKVDVVVGRPMDQKEVFAVELDRFGTQVGVFVALPVAVRSGHSHVALGVCRVCQEIIVLKLLCKEMWANGSSSTPWHLSEKY